MNFLEDSQGKFQTIELDTAEVSRINSIGVREWVILIDKLQKAHPIRFSKLSEPLVELAGSIPKILGKAGTPVGQFAAPYLCEGCGNRVTQMIRVEEVDSRSLRYTGQPPKCSKCGVPMVFDALEEEYFNFLGQKS